MKLFSIQICVIFGLLVGAASAIAQTCLKIENIRGYSASENEDYQMNADTIPGEMVFCYVGENGKFDNNDGLFTRFGSNTWIWFNAIDATEVAEVWTFDFTNRKALFARTRGVGALLPQTTGAYVGDITEAISE